jgi:hypothetical protein
LDEWIGREDEDISFEEIDLTAAYLENCRFSRCSLAAGI